MYGLIGKMMTVDGKRSELTALLLEAVTRMPGCLSYVVAEDTTDDQGRPSQGPSAQGFQDPG